MTALNSCSNLPLHVNQHQSWLMRNEKYFIDFWSILDVLITLKKYLQKKPWQTSQFCLLLGRFETNKNGFWDYLPFITYKWILINCTHNFKIMFLCLYLWITGNVQALNPSQVVQPLALCQILTLLLTTMVEWIVEFSRERYKIRKNKNQYSQRKLFHFVNWLTLV